MLWRLSSKTLLKLACTHLYIACTHLYIACTLHLHLSLAQGGLFRPCLDAHYPLTHHSSIITYHLKYPNFLKVARLAHCFQLLITQKIVLSVGTIPEHHVNKFCYPTRLTLISFHFLHCSFLLQPFNPVTLPKPETNPTKIKDAQTCGADLHRHQGRLISSDL